MQVVTINFMAVLLAAASTMVVGYVWYSMPVFGKAWMKLIGKSEDDLKKGATQAYALMFVLSLLMAYVLAHFIGYANAYTLSGGAQAGFWAAIGFVVPVLGSDAIFSGKPRNLFLITAGYQVVAITIAGGIIGAMGM